MRKPIQNGKRSGLLGARKTEPSGIVFAYVWGKRLGQTEAQVANSVGWRISQGGQRPEPKSTTDGGCAKGIPRNLFVPLTVVPMNVPPSSVTIGLITSVEGAAKTVAVSTQTATSDARRKTMTTREKEYRSASETSGQIHEKECRLFKLRSLVSALGQVSP